MQIIILLVINSILFIALCFVLIQLRMKQKEVNQLKKINDMFLDYIETIEEASIVQQGERFTCNEDVRGSGPLRGSN